MSPPCVRWVNGEKRVGQALFKQGANITRIDAKKDLGIWLSPNLSFSLHLEKSAHKAFAVLRMIRRTFSRITRTDFQILYGAYVRPLLEYANPVVYSGRTKDVILIERVQRAATKMVAGLKSMDYETRLVVLDLFPLEYRRLRGHLILTCALFEQGLANTFFTVDPANTRRGHEYIRWNEGFASGSVYPKDSTLADLSSRVFKEFIWTNPLHPDLFPDVRRMEAEVVRMCLSMFHGDGDACGTMTSGGTESIMLACLAYRERARAKGIRNPAIVLAESAHPAFDKAAHYFDLDVVHVPVDPISCKADVAAMRSAITGSTCMIVASAPGFPHGIIDPVRELASLGSRYGIPVHVDCCLGGFLLPFMEAADCELEPFDFRLPGVTSISCDTHKYGFAAKGTSVIMYRNKHYRSKQYFTQPNWPGGVYASATFAGSRSGALIAVCWATMMYFGRQGYTDSTRRIVKTTQFIASELRKIPGIVVYGDPQVCVVAFGSDRFDIYRLAQGLSELPNGRGWCLNALQFPPALHLCVTDLHTVEGRAEGFIRDVSTVAAELYDHPENYSGGAAALYGACATIPDRSIISEVAVGYLDACYDTPSPKTEETKRKE
ncbi:sphingosine-1-phosphate lyase 1 [Clonorchis sinensis]|uniref:sphinganine-1-phosphate aldolase n=1 Tax=Clonorchis sinensis TaxID=79923 RepID=G7YRS4_CLOSI|nr:sphingosine-1-phosphate lyase 1 [Clonorchis sinensis]